jgi:hypothetical protein
MVEVLKLLPTIIIKFQGYQRYCVSTDLCVNGFVCQRIACQRIASQRLHYIWFSPFSP